MPTSPLYDSTRATLRQHLPEVIDSQLDTLGLLIVGAVQSLSSQAAKIARALPLDTTQLAKEQRLRRFLDNERVTQTDHYQPIVKQALQGLKGQRVQLLMDRVLLRDHHNILVVSVGFRRRSIPLAWVALSHRGSSNLEERKELLQSAVKLLPNDVRISVHGDSEFRTTAFFDWLRTHGYDVMVGVVGHSLVYDTDEPTTDGQSLAQRVGAAQGVVSDCGALRAAERVGLVGTGCRWQAGTAWRDDQSARDGAHQGVGQAAHVD
jgi:hypothetical protein